METESVATASAEAEAEIRALLDSYQLSLTNSDHVLAASCYTKDGVFMPTTLPTSSGSALLEAYAAIFSRIRLKVGFTVDELVVASDRVAYALTHSNGTQVTLASGDETEESNREVFVFARESGEWKIARYMFNKSR